VYPPVPFERPSQLFTHTAGIALTTLDTAAGMKHCDHVSRRGNHGDFDCGRLDDEPRRMLVQIAQRRLDVDVCVGPSDALFA
jgi:hypothetical protein